MPICNLLELQFINRFFNRYDLFVRILAYRGDWSLYNKMENARGVLNVPDCQSAFIHLIKNFKKNGYDKSQEIVLTSTGIIFDGIHRVVCCIENNIENIIYHYAHKFNTFPRYTKLWFKEYGFTDFEICKMEMIKKEVFNKYGIITD